MESLKEEWRVLKKGMLKEMEGREVDIKVIIYCVNREKEKVGY